MDKPRTKTQALAAAVEGMKSKVCGWPHCDCKAEHDRLYHEAVAMADETQPCPTQYEWDAMYVAATVNLAAISACVTDRRERYIATISLLQPTFREDRFHAALQRLCDADEAEPAPADPELEPSGYAGPEVDLALLNYGPSLLGTAGKETLLQRKARHDEIARRRRMTLREVPAAEAPEPKKGTAL
jgi:hypothetical protein